jgi:hypothetical protein
MDKQRYTKENLDSSITDNWNNLEEAAIVSFPPFLPKTKYVPWWSPNLNSLQKQVNALKRRVQRCKTQTLKDLYMARFKALKFQYKCEILTTKQESWRNNCTDSSKNTHGKCPGPAKRAFQGILPPSR